MAVAEPARTRKQRRHTGRPTMEDVARLASVSPATVSRVLRQPDIVSSDLAEKVRAAITRLDYLPNLMAGSLAAQTVRQVGVIVPSILNAFFSATVDALTQALSESGYQVMLGTTDYLPGREEAVVESFLAWSPAAMVLTGLVHSPRAQRLLRDAGVPVVEMWDLGPAPIDLLVGFSHEGVGRAMTRHLLERGRQRIVFLGADLEHDTRAAQRRDGYIAAMREAGHEPLVHAPAQRSSVSVGAQGFGEAVERFAGIDAVFCQNDVLALGALFEARRRAIEVPAQIAVGGFGDLDFAGQTVPRLTTVRPPARELGRKAAELILAVLEGRTPTQRVYDLGFTLRVRAST
jgi:LacI family transcriptional regulator, gluconate utilization system Gnt-I transcriptional repressor